MRQNRSMWYYSVVQNLVSAIPPVPSPRGDARREPPHNGHNAQGHRTGTGVGGVSRVACDV
jgi:hypothetical protein